MRQINITIKRNNINAELTTRRIVISLKRGVSLSGGNDTYKVKATSTDANPDFLDNKVDNSTIEVDASNKLKVKDDVFALKRHTHTASDITDFDIEVSNNTDVQANTNARHTHSNKAVLDAITNAGSGEIITATERSQLTDAYNHSQVTSGNPHQVTASDVEAVSIHGDMMDGTLTLQESQTGLLQINTAAGDNVLRVDTDTRRVGINTSAPTADFDINGDLQATTASIIGALTADTIDARVKGFTAVNDSTPQSIPDSTWTKVTAFHTVDYNYGSWYDSSTGTFTIGEDGLYLIGGFVTFDTIHDGKKVVVMLRKNGNPVRLLGRGTVGATDTFGAGGSSLVLASTGDQFNIYVYQNDGSTIDTSISAGYCWFFGFKVGIV